MYKAIYVIVITIIMVFSACNATAGCTKNDYEEMRAAGFSAKEIRDICFPEDPKAQIPRTQQQPEIPHTQIQQQALGQNCKTAHGVCTLAHLPPSPIGTPCYCVNRYTGKKDPGYIAF